MRQAGRYLPEYRKVRSQQNSFLDLCFNPEKVCEVTLQPIKRFDLDFAIIFSDILVIPYAGGMKVDFIEKKGPILSGEFNNFEVAKLQKIYDGISLTRKDLPKNKPLIGFSGGVFTLLTYIITKGKVTGKEDLLIANIKNNKKKYQLLAQKIEKAVIDHLIMQIKSGVNIIKIFDSWAGLVRDDSLFDEFVVGPAVRIRNKLKELYPNIPIMFFPRNIGKKYREFVQKVRPDVITIDYNTDLKWAKSNIADNIILQGNLNPDTLLGSKSEIAASVRKIENTLGKGRYIFNLGHGILPQTPIDNVEYMLEVLRNG